MVTGLWGDPDSFARYKLANVTLVGLRSELAKLREAPEGEPRRDAIARNNAATRLASVEVEAAFLAYLPERDR